MSKTQKKNPTKDSFLFLVWQEINNVHVHLHVLVIIMGFSNNPKTPRLVVLSFWHIWTLTIKISIYNHTTYFFIVKIKIHFVSHKNSSRKFTLLLPLCIVHVRNNNKAVYQSLKVHVTLKFKQTTSYISLQIVFEINNCLQKKWHYALKTGFLYFSSMLHV